MAGINMIRETLTQTKMATFAVLVPHPDPSYAGFPTPNGTGFFVSKDGYFITARHVLEKKDDSGKAVIHNSAQIKFVKPEIIPQVLVDNIALTKDWPEYDLALLKADFAKNKNKDAFKDKDGFDFLEVDFDIIPEGTDIYSFGYPLPNIEVHRNQHVMIGFHYFCPRVTSAVISSHYDVIGPVFGVGFPRYYIIDKALTYGNSGGPRIVSGTGKVISVCVRFQPVKIRQDENVSILVPSLYGITSSLKNIETELSKCVVSCNHDFVAIIDRKNYFVTKCSKCGKIQKIWK